MLSLAAAVSAPFCTTSQKALPGTPWVIMAIVARGVSAVPPAIAPPVFSGLPPVLEHPAARTVRAARVAAAHLVSRRRCCRVVVMGWSYRVVGMGVAGGVALGVKVGMVRVDRVTANVVGAKAV